MKHPIHRAILASAGTGKTFQLTNRYIELLAAGVDPSTILATTFTRKAAGEILDRILGRLAAASTSVKDLRELQQHVSPSLTHDRCRELTVGFARQLHRLSILTLDAFFARMTAGLGPQMGMSPQWRIIEEEEDQVLRARAVQAALRECDRGQMLAFIQMLNKGSYGREVQGVVARVVNEAYDAYQHTLKSPQAWDVFGPDAPRRQWRLLARADLQAAMTALRTVSLPQNQGGTPNKVWTRSHALVCSCAQEDRWEDFLQVPLVIRVFTGVDFAGHNIPPAVTEAYSTLISHAAYFALTRLKERNTATRDVMARFDAAYQRCKQATAGYRFDDIPRMLLAQDADDRLHNLYFQLDARLRHILLDEFQDTSTVQFDLLLPIIEELVSTLDASSSLFCVGDVKQSLYSWRGGEPELLPSIPQRWPQVTTLPLNENFRSSPVILETVNTVFSRLPSNAALVDERDVANAWSARFEPHIAGKPHLPGLARLLVAPAARQPDEQRQTTLAYAATRVVDILRAAPGTTVGVLTRANEPIARLLFELKALKVPASGEGGNPLVDSPPVAVAISLLQLAHHPADSAALYHVATSPLGPALGLTNPQDLGPARALAAKLRRRLADEGYAPALSWLHTLCAASMDDRELARFEQLIALAQVFDSTPNAGLTDFITIVHQRPIEDPGRQSVRVMTIHRAKGLQFDAVVLPDLDRGWKNNHPAVLLDRRDSTGRHGLGPVTAATTYPNESLRALHPGLEDLHEHSRARELNEELCSLYVAMTRPIHLLEAIVHPSKKPPTLCPAGVLRAALAPDKTADPETELWRSPPHGPDTWSSQIAAAPVNRTSPTLPDKIPLAEPGPVPFARLRRTSPSQLARQSAPTVSAAALLDPGSNIALDRGTLLHAWFELIEWLDDGPPTEAMLDAVMARIGIQGQAEHSAAFRAALEGDVGRALRRSRYAHRSKGMTLEVRREWSFAVRDNAADEGVATPSLLTGQLDRVVIGRNADGHPAWAEVLDFKSDTTSHADMKSKASQYIPQMAAYRRAVSSMLGADVPVTSVLLFTSSGLVAPIG